MKAIKTLAMMLITVLTLSMVQADTPKTPNRGCDKDGKNCTHQCSLNGVCRKIIKKKSPTKN